MKHFTTGRTQENRGVERAREMEIITIGWKDGKKEERRMGKYHDGDMRVIPRLRAHPGKDGTLRCSSLPAGPPCAQTRAAVFGNSASSFPGEELRAGMKRQRRHIQESVCQTNTGDGEG